MEYVHIHLVSLQNIFTPEQSIYSFLQHPLPDWEPLTHFLFQMSLLITWKLIVIKIFENHQFELRMSTVYQKISKEKRNLGFVFVLLLYWVSCLLCLNMLTMIKQSRAHTCCSSSLSSPLFSKVFFGCPSPGHRNTEDCETHWGCRATWVLMLSCFWSWGAAHALLWSPLNTG